MTMPFSRTVAVSATALTAFVISRIVVLVESVETRYGLTTVVFGFMVALVLSAGLDLVEWFGKDFKDP